MKKGLLSLFFLIYSVSAYGEDLEKTVSEAFELYSVGNYEEAASLFEEAWDTAAELVKTPGDGILKIALYAGLSQRGAGEYGKSAGWFRRALSIAERTDRKKRIPSILAYLGEAERLSGDSAKAVETYKKALGYAGLENKDRAVLYYGLAESFRLKGDYTQAETACMESAELAAPLGLDRLVISCEIVKGETYRMTGRYAQALRSFGAARDTARARKYPEIMIAALNGMGLSSEILGRKDAARGNFEEALNAAVKNGLLDNVELISSKISSLLPEKGDFSQQAASAVSAADMGNSPDVYAKIALYNLASDYYLAGGDYSSAFIASGKAYKEAALLAPGAEVVNSLYGMAAAFYGLEKYSLALAKADEALSQASALGVADKLSSLFALKSEILLRLNRFEESVYFMDEAARQAETGKKASLEKRLLEIKNITEKSSSPAGYSGDNHTRRKP